MLLAAAIARAGRRAELVDAVDVVTTDGHFGGASPLIPESAAGARKALQPLLKARTVPVVPGFIGRAPDGGVATLGRGGSDLTATLLGRAFNAPMVTLWKDVPGILTSDPKLVPDTRLIPQLHHQEAAEVAHYGAKVLHPRALIPISGTKVVLEVRSFLEPTRPGTIVAGRHVSTSYPVKAVAVLPKQAVVTVAGKGMVGVHGIAARTFAAVDAERLSVSTIFQGSSESSIGFTLPEAEAERAVASLRRAFRDEIAGGLIDGVTARARHVGHRGGRRRHGRHARHRRPRLHGARDQRHQRRGDRAGLVGTQHLVRGVGRRMPPRPRARCTPPSSSRRSAAAGRRPRPSTDVVLLGFGRVGRALADAHRDLAGEAPRAHRRPARPLGLRLRRARTGREAAALAGANRRTPARC